MIIFHCKVPLSSISSTLIPSDFFWEQSKTSLNIWPTVIFDLPEQQDQHYLSCPSHFTVEGITRYNLAVNKAAIRTLHHENNESVKLSLSHFPVGINGQS